MATFDTGMPTFGVQKVIIAAGSDGTYGTPVTFPSVKTIGFDFTTVSDEADGDMRVTALAAQAIKQTMTMDVAGLNLDVLAVLTGLSKATFSSTQNTMAFPNFRYQYFGLVAQGWAAENNGDTLLWIPKCKVMKGFTFKMEFGKILVPNFKFDAILDDTAAYIWKMDERPDNSVAFTIPPTWN